MVQRCANAMQRPSESCAKSSCSWARVSKVFLFSRVGSAAGVGYTGWIEVQICMRRRVVAWSASSRVCDGARAVTQSLAIATLRPPHSPSCAQSAATGRALAQQCVRESSRPPCHSSTQSFCFECSLKCGALRSPRVELEPCRACLPTILS